MALAPDTYHRGCASGEAAGEGCCETCEAAFPAERPPHVPAGFCSAACYHEQRHLVAWAEALLRVQFACERPVLRHGLPRC